MIAALFVLPTRGGNGGANSVIQEATALARMGCHIGITVQKKQLADFRSSYPELASAGIRLHSFGDTADLAKDLAAYDIVIATIYTSVALIAEAVASAKSPIKVAYYVQDYEPLFHEADTDAWRAARDSYRLIPSATLFAKTEWLQDMVERNHGIRPEKVAPSIDHGIYYPDIAAPRNELTVAAMLRPSTPRRAPHRTLRVMARLAQQIPSARFTVFGCDDDALAAANLELPAGVENIGRLRRTEVPDLLRRADVFIDASDYQAFGRTGLEAMASGCVPVLPTFGGAHEYAVHERNAYLVDSRSDQSF
ncbi:MAG: glycosyltransferase, partial [Brevundimonas sp.]